MSYSYLQRTPTSTGNRKTWTWGAWVKNNNPDTNGNTLFCAASDQQNRFWLRYRSAQNSSISLTQTQSNASTIQIGTQNLVRDVSSWHHIMVAYDSTKVGDSNNDSAIDMAGSTVKIYMNGVRHIDYQSETFVASNNNIGEVNKTIQHMIGNSQWASSPTTLQFSDIFFVDGQALTPDVFGFYKDGDGYMSSGSSYATDFRPGQWMPHAPSKIKKDINRRGGFGVNGFYLPMNDSSNPGADFHCSPNSIITLKGEDLPQPRNGAPTTSDAYVSQLRPETTTLGFDGVATFDGNGDYLSIADHADLDLGTGDFTIEFFAYARTSSAHAGYIGKRNPGSFNNNSWRIAYNDTYDNINLLHADSGANFTAASAPAPGKDWTHYAFTRQSGTLRVFRNGLKTSEATGWTYDFSNAYNLLIGANVTSSYFFDGFLSNVRIIKGTALYTANFTAPTEALTNVTNTKLLCCNSSTSATASTVTPGTITASGNVFASKNELTASMVLAVPGIALENTNTELVTNGTFTSNITGWTGYNSTPTWDSLYQRLAIDASTEYDGAETSSGVSVSASTNYTLEVDVDLGTAGGVRLQVRNSANSASLAFLDVSGSGTYAVNFASGSNTSVYIRLITSAGNTGTAYFDNVSLKLANAVRDYSADIKGSGTNKTLTPYDTAGVGYELGNYYGSAMNFEGTGDDDYFDTGYSIDGTFGSGDYTIECWIHTLDDQSERGIFGMFGSQYGISMRQFGSYNAGGNQTLQAFFGQSTAGYRCGTTVRIQDQWNHVAMVKEGTKGTLYLNGVAVGIADNVSSTPYSTSNLLIGIYYNGQYPYKGYMQDFRVYTTAKYKGGFDVPKPYTPVGIEAFRTVADTCKNNFATLNPLIGAGTASGDTVPALKDGNLLLDNANQTQTQSSIGMSSGKWYCEYRLTSSSVAAGGYYGVVGDELSGKNNQNTYTSVGFGHIRPGTGSNSYTKNWTATSLTTENPALGFVSGDIFGFALDLDSSPKNIKYYRNGTLIHTDSTIGESSHYHFLALRTNDGASGANWPDVYANFGQNPSFSGTVTAGTNADDSGKGLFKYAPPTGFLALCEDNLPAPVIADPGKHFKTVLYTGTNTNKSVTGVGFKPGFVWTKERNGTEVPAFYDEVRKPPNVLYSSETNSEENNSGYLYSFDDDGFTVGSADLSNNDPGEYVAWCWKAGGPAVSNTDGSITAQVSANQTAGFSIAKWTGTGANGTIGHGLSAAPEIMIVKGLDNTDHWFVYSSSLTTSQYLYLNLTSTIASGANAWNSTAPTNSVFSIGDDGGVNGSSNDYIAYCWHGVEGFSKFGTFEGSDSQDGAFVYLGFKPALVIAKQIDTAYTVGGSAATSWGMWDSSRMPNNPAGNPLWANFNSTETTRGNGSSANTGGSDGNGLGGFLMCDLLSNGFKARSAGSEFNSPGTNIYMAWAESPFQTANAK